MDGITKNNNVAASPTIDAIQEHDQVIQFFQAALTKTSPLELSQAEQQGLFTLMEWRRDSLQKIAISLSEGGEANFIDADVAGAGALHGRQHLCPLTVWQSP